ncbi:copper resistance CopC family protein [Azospirillum sp. sgz302134]
MVASGRAWIALCGLLALLLTPSVGHAHAVVKDSTPAEGAVLTGPDADVSVRFNSRVDHARSRLSLAAGKGEPAALPIADNSPPDALTGRATGLAPGAYRLLWQVLSVDGHITRGEIRFRVKGP